MFVISRHTGNYAKLYGVKHVYLDLVFAFFLMLFRFWNWLFE